jgi:glycosyltransferase involved in cell wall biosynthesis
MRILHINRSDLNGGAARAAHRIHTSQVRAGLDSEMRVIEKLGDDVRVIGGRPADVGDIEHAIRGRLSRLPLRRFHTEDPILHSTAWPDTGLGRELARSDADILNLHWLGSSTLSIEEVGRLEKPVVWTLHDMWAFCGAEHYAADHATSRFRRDYTRHNAPDSETANDLNRRVWSRKRNSWRRPIHIVCPSRWLADCSLGSSLFSNWPVTVIPYPIDPNVWRPVPRRVAREALGLSQSAHIVLLGAPGGFVDRRKGADLALAALAQLAARSEGPDQILVFGQSAEAGYGDLPLPTRFLGPLKDDLSLVLAYSAADAFVLSSRQDNLPNTGIESLACGTPVVAFDIGGLPDIIDHRQTGWLARPFDHEDLAAGINWVLSDAERAERLGIAARETATTRFSEPRVAAQYRNLYEGVAREHATSYRKAVAIAARRPNTSGQRPSD